MFNNYEEYKKEFIRMMDSSRRNNYKGRYNCQGVRCDNCHIGNQYCEAGVDILCFDRDTYNYLAEKAQVISIVENWAKEHPEEKEDTLLLYDVKCMKYDNVVGSSYYGNTEEVYLDITITKELAKRLLFNIGKPLIKSGKYTFDCVNNVFLDPMSGEYYKIIDEDGKVYKAILDHFGHTLVDEISKGE